uniref:Uncharacterized protein n=1 Tax=Anguilla anguilla TaxID=7936 RepID=A0A0E9PCA1_ANGAN
MNPSVHSNNYFTLIKLAQFAYRVQQKVYSVRVFFL